MRSSSLVLAAAALLAAPSLALAQSRGSSPLVSNTVFEATPYVGYMFFGDYLSGPLGTAVTNAPAPVIGAQLGMKLAPNLSLVGNIATASSDIQAGIPILGGVSIAQSRVQMFDAGLQLALPVSSMSGTSFTPFIQAGAGAMRYDITESFATTTSTNFAANVGLGADVSVGNGVGIRVMAKDYIGQFDMQQATYLDIGTNTTNSYAFSAGVRFSF
ncbi:MAG TPA: outer membrane beta-barrel protein [Gemmatimonadaceae bacterium]|nr:outer membrane beta-barrel protein [Gemmatimonadaceae bacterium]